MLKGAYSHTIDAKGRIILPAAFREELGEHFVITKGFDNCLFVYGEAAWQVLEDKLAALPMGRPEARATVRFFLSAARSLECDRQGRFLVPGNLKKYAMLEKDVELVGTIGHVEVWSKAEWERYNDVITPTVSSMAESLADLGF